MAVTPAKCVFRSCHWIGGGDSDAAARRAWPVVGVMVGRVVHARRLSSPPVRREVPVGVKAVNHASREWEWRRVMVEVESPGSVGSVVDVVRVCVSQR